MCHLCISCISMNATAYSGYIALYSIAIYSLKHEGRRHVRFAVDGGNGGCHRMTTYGAAGGGRVYIAVDPGIRYL